MKTIGLEYYKEFRCLGGACPVSCCKGWNIALDEKTYENYRKAKGIRGVLLRASLTLLDGRLPAMRNIGHSCPHHTREGLCRFQKKGEPEYMPKVCRVYPRRGVWYGDCTEVMFELSCVEAARLFLRHTTRQRFCELPETDPLGAETAGEEAETGGGKPAEGEPPREEIRPAQAPNRMEFTWVLENDDPPFRAFLRRDREKLLDRIWEEGRSLEEAMADIYAYVWEQERNILGGRFREAERMQEAPMRQVSDREIQNPFYEVTMLNDLIYQSLDTPDLQLRNPTLKRMIRNYQRVYGKLWEAEANAYYRKAMRELLQSGFLPENKYRAYFSYCLQELYCEAYEDYYILGPVFLSLIYTEFLMLFDTASFRKNGELSMEKQVRELAALEKGIRHSLQTKEELLQKIRKDFL